MKLPEAIQSAAQAKIQAALKPVAERLTRLRAVLDSYEALAKQDAERTVSNALLMALGEAPDVAGDQAFDVAKRELREALSQVAELVGAPEPPKRTEPEPVPPPPAPTVNEVPPLPAPEATKPKVEPPPPPPPPSRPSRKATPDDITWAKRLIAEVENLRHEVKQQPVLRLSPLLQALVAEVRHLLDRLPEDNYLHERLGTLVPTLGAMRHEGGVDEFIKGLAFGHTGDWERIAFRCRRKVEEFDRDVARSERSPDVHTPKPKKAPVEAEPEKPNGYQWPALPHLRGLSKPILLAGGLIVPEKIRSVQERFGLEVEWHEIDHDNPRASQTLMSRVRAGKVGALILLEGVMRHSTYKPVVEACNNMHVPFAMGDKAGVASLQSAFNELERKMS